MYGISKVHDPNTPHFEVEIYKREKDAFSAILYFSFDELEDSTLMDYAKGTIFLIERILEKFISNKNLSEKFINKLIYREIVLSELCEYEGILIDALSECFRNNELVVRKQDEVMVIKTKHNLKKYLGSVSDLQPLYLSLVKRLEQ